MAPSKYHSLAGTESNEESPLWPRPTFLVAAGSVLLLVLLVRRWLTSRRYLSHVANEKIRLDDEDVLGDLPPPLRSVYHHQDPHHNVTSAELVAEASTRQLHRQDDITSRALLPSRRHSCPMPSVVPEYHNSIQHPVESLPPPYSQLVYDQVQLFPLLDEHGQQLRPGHWRRRTLIYG